MKIVFMGYMGSGKSTLGRQLAKSLQLPFIDLDDYIVEKEQNSIKELFKQRGEIYFRLKESSYLKEVLEIEHPLVLSLGGGTPCYADNMSLIKKESLSFYLKAGVGTLCKRLRNETNQRPLIASLDDQQLTEFIAKHLFERREYYEKADHIINLDNKSVEDILAKVKGIITPKLI